MWGFFRMPNTAASLERHHSPRIYEELKHFNTCRFDPRSNI